MSANNTRKVPVMISKEKIGELRFPREEVLKSNDLIRKRKESLMLGERLGNGMRGKVKITFEDNEGIKQVETTIWAATEENISIKGGLFIPINRILDVRPY